MQFILIAHDDNDKEALQRRQKARLDHIKNTDINIKNMIMGVATLNDEGNMNGSVMIVDFPTRQDLDIWLQSEPYVVQNVWKKITILPCKVGPSFISRFPEE